MRSLYFISGASAPADIRGLARWSVPLGVSLPELSRAALRVLCEHWEMPLVRVFVDSGAFSEVDRTGAVVAPIGDAAWSDRVRTMHEIAAAFGPPVPLGDGAPRVYFVAPDRVADQVETLRRLALHADGMRACRALGARVVVPIQRGQLSAAAFDASCCAALGFEDFARGIPGNKAAMPPDELEGFLRARRPRAVHLLGVGPRSPSFEAMATLVRRILGDAELSCDSNALAAAVGRTNGRGGGPRRLTAMQDMLSGPSWAGVFRGSPREMAVRLMFGVEHLHNATMLELVRRGEARVAAPSPLQMDLFDRVP